MYKCTLHVLKNNKIINVTDLSGDNPSKTEIISLK